MKTPHKHAELIKAWADGAEIEMETLDGWVLISPSWSEEFQHRIKPEPKISAEAEILIADLINWTSIDARNGEHSSGQWAAFESLKAYIFNLEQQVKP